MLAPGLASLLATAGAAGALTPKRVVLVTGANKGIGKEIARAIGRMPDHTVVLGCRDLELAEAAAAELRASGCDDVHTARVDLTDASSFDDTAKLLESNFGRLDALVNNAAICFNDPTLYGRCEFTPFEKQARLASDRRPRSC
eukprot:3222617-Prymnesium_polylepis.1